MDTITNSTSKTHSYVQSTVTAFLILSLVVALPVVSFAQTVDKDDQSKKVTEEAKLTKEELYEQIKEKTGIDPASRFEQNVQSGVDLGSLNDRYLRFQFDQSWALAQNPNPDLNVPVSSSGHWVGDINGDGQGDYLFQAFPRNINTPQLEDRHGKTVVFFGGNTSQTPDQILEGARLAGMGDLNGDGINDAVSFTDGTIYHGSSNGLVKSSLSLSLANPSELFSIHTVGDLDGDGIDDALLDRDSGFRVFWGDASGNEGQSSTDFSTTPNSNRSFTEVVYNSGDFNNDGDNELYLMGFDQNTNENVLRVLDVSSDRTFVTVLQDTAINTQNSLAFFSDFHVFDLNGSGFQEVLVRQFNPDTTDSFLAFGEDSTNSGSISPDPITLYRGFTSRPVGDLNDDGRLDFLLVEPGTNDLYLGYTPADLSNGLTLDYELTNSTSGTFFFRFDGQYFSPRIGDMDGDGIDDFVIGHNNFIDTGEIGRRIVNGDGTNTPPSTFVMYPNSQFFDNIFETQNVGDLNGDGFDDFVFNRPGTKAIEVYFGGSQLSQTPDLTLDAEFTFQGNNGDTFISNPIGMKGGDFNGDGFNDIVVSDNIGIQARVYFGGSNMDGTMDHKIVGEDFKNDGGSLSTFYLVANVGDVNEDGIDDFLLGSLLGGHDGVPYNEAYLFYGNSTSLPSAPDVTINLSNDTTNVGVGWESEGLGDINGDGVDDFAVTVRSIQNDNGSSGQVHVFFGGSGKTYSSADLVLKPENEFTFGFGTSIAAGDYDGDGSRDIAVASLSAFDNSFNPAPNINIYRGGSDLDAVSDKKFGITTDAIGSTSSSEFITFYNGQLNTLSDFNQDRKDELFAGAWTSGSNSVLFSWGFANDDSTSAGEPFAFLEGPNQAAPLGGIWNQAIGDFNNDGAIDAVLAQAGDDNDAFVSSRQYRYAIGKPITLTDVQDVPDDQGGWVRVNVGGFLMDALQQENILGFDNWSVWRQVTDTSWTNVGTVPAFGEDAGFVDVHVPVTQKSDTSDTTANFKFKVMAFDNDEGVLAVSDVMTGFALDNLAPVAPTGLAAQKTSSTVDLSWDPVDEEDLKQYEIFEVNADGSKPDTAATSTINTSASLSANLFDGFTYFTVRGTDIHKNSGEESEPKEVILPKTISYEFSEGWNLIGLPLDMTVSDYLSLFPNLEEGSLYTYDGSYKEATSLEPGKGYWVKAPTLQTENVEDLPIKELTLQLREGWNMISGVGRGVSVTDISDPNNLIVSGTLFNYDQAYQTSSSVDPGNGYWLKSSASGSITLKVTGPGSGSSSTEMIAGTNGDDGSDPMEQVKEEFNTISVEDGNGHHRTLYFGETLPDRLSMDNFSMPPLPMGEYFAARFVEDQSRLTESDNFRIRVSSMDKNPLTMNFSLQPTYKYRNFTLKEYVSGQLVSERIVGEDEAIELYSSDVDIVEVSAQQGMADGSDQLPTEYNVKQNYPNPFNPSTVIRYALPEAVSVQIEVYNVLGHKVATLVNEQQEAGRHKVTFNASGLSSGLYFMHMTAGSFQKVQKMMLIK